MVGVPASTPSVSEEEFGRVWQVPPGFLGRLRTVQNTPLGVRFIGMSLFFFVAAGVNALLMRLQLATPENAFLSPAVYNQLFTMHGTTMMFLFAVPLIEGIATLVLPQMLGARELPFPRLTAFAFWTSLFGGLVFYSSLFFGMAPDAGWFAYVPLSGPEFSPGPGMDFYLLGLNVAEIGAIAGAFEIVIATLFMRAPGMTISRVPVFAWALLITAFAMIFAFIPLIVGTWLLELDRLIETKFFDYRAGGSTLLWQHLFWVFGHPDVYIQFIPAAGIISSVIPVFSRRPLAAHNVVIAGLIAIAFLSFGLWVHHMFAVGFPLLALAFFTAASMMIAVPSGVQVIAWITTLWAGRPSFKTPLLFALGFLVIFVLGGLTGVMVAIVPFDWQAHDSFFVVAHFHYVMIGGVVFPIFAGLYFWAPKFTGRMLSERLGQISFWLMLFGFSITFFPMHISGLLGMPRRVYTYPADLGWEPYNLVSTIGAFVLASGVAVTLANLIGSMRFGSPATDNPWGADTLEWMCPTPPP